MTAYRSRRFSDSVCSLCGSLWNAKGTWGSMKGAMITDEKIEEVGRYLGKAARAKRVVVFGSHATGQAQIDSDVDYLVIAESSLPRHKRSRSLYALFRPYPFPMDILVYTPEEVETQLRDPSSFLAEALSQAREVYVG